jgi:type VI secretion system secreted protein VgrG
MPRYSQTDRVVRVEVPSLGDDVLLLEGFSGEEHVSEPFEFTLQLLSEETSIDPKKVLREPMILTIRLPDGSDRKIHGLCYRFGQGGRDEELTSYEAEIVPWLWFLSLNQDCKIFQQKTVLEIIEEVFGKYGNADFDNKCVESYSPREYCVQYRESDLDFVSRLMEEEGIFYFFQHSNEGHKLILADDRSAVEACEGQDIFRVEQSPDTRVDEDVITELEREHQVYTAKVTITDYDFVQPSMNLESSASDEDYEEIYDYPGKYSKLSDGERYASLRLQEKAAAQEVVRGVGKCRAFRSGYEFDLSEHYRADSNQTYFLKSVWHSAHGGGYRTSGGEAEYSNEFECIPSSIPFRPASRTPKPVVQGSQTALVVGPSGEEIFTEKNGQVKVQFHWDRVGQKDENSSCWVRASHPWAGKGWGAVSIPRIGQEVIIDFLEGDPDRPIITGRVYNAEVMPPFPLPDGAVVSGIKSDSHKGSGYNEMSMNDTPGEEKFTVNAQYDKGTTVGNDSTESVGNNRSSSVSVDDSLSVGSNQSVDIGSNQTVSVSGDRTVSVGGSQTTEVSGTRSVTVSGADSVATSADHSLDASGAINLTRGAAMAINVGAGLDANASANIKIGAGGTIEISAPGGIKLMAGGSSIDMTPGSISINGAGLFEVVAGLIKHNG